jgi:hypothetical protein
MKRSLFWDLTPCSPRRKNIYKYVVLLSPTVLDAMHNAMEIDRNGPVPSYNPAKGQIYLLITPCPRESGANQIIQLPHNSFTEQAGLEIKLQTCI